MIFKGGGKNYDKNNYLGFIHSFCFSRMVLDDFNFNRSNKMCSYMESSIFKRWKSVDLFKVWKKEIL